MELLPHLLPFESYNAAFVRVTDIPSTRLPGRVDGPALLLAAHYDSIGAGPGTAVAYTTYWLFGWLNLLVTLFPMLAVIGAELRRELRRLD